MLLPALLSLWPQVAYHGFHELPAETRKVGWGWGGALTFSTRSRDTRARWAPRWRTNVRLLWPLPVARRAVCSFAVPRIARRPTTPKRHRPPLPVVHVYSTTLYSLSLAPLPAFHALNPLQAVYNGSHSTSGGTGAGVFDEAAGFAMVDTLFSLAEAYLYMQLVELKVGVF